MGIFAKQLPTETATVDIDDSKFVVTLTGTQVKILEALYNQILSSGDTVIRFYNSAEMNGEMHRTLYALYGALPPERYSSPSS